MTELLQVGFTGFAAVGPLPALFVLIGMFLPVSEFLCSYFVWVGLSPGLVSVTSLILMGLVVSCSIFFGFLSSFRGWFGVQGTVFFNRQHSQMNRIDTPSILAQVVNLVVFWWEQSFVGEKGQPVCGRGTSVRANSPISIGINCTNPVPTFGLRVLFRVLRYVPLRICFNSRSAAAQAVTVKDSTPAAFGIRDGRSAVSTTVSVFVCNHPNILPQEV